MYSSVVLVAVVSYYAYDVHGYVGDLASGPGWHKFVAWASAQGGQLAQLANSGKVTQLNTLAAEAARAHAGDASNDSIRANLIALARTADEVLIVSDGEDAR